jgi:ParB family transcriptional regulator, chromosome partitioning protein
VTQPKRGLGRGLGALLGDTPVPVSAAQDQLREIPVAAITPNPFQPRKSFDEATLDDLKNSIAEYGVLVPIIVRRRDAGYELVAGERRWRACAALQRATIPAIVRQSDDRDSLEVAIVENLQRENLNAIEEAAGFAQLIEDHDFTQEDVARRLGKSRPTIANALRLLSLPDAIKAMLVAGTLSAGHGKALLSAPESRRVALARRAVDESLNVRQLEHLASTSDSAAPARTAAQDRRRELSPEENDFESRLRERFGTHVAIVRSGAGGRIELRFANDGELVRIGELLLEED